MEKKFKEALDVLPADQRAIFVLRVFDHQNYKDIAQILNIPEGTVMSRLSRARHKLRQEMAEYLEGGRQ
jgi:RNA polymerase sigma-70 factor (ECF subfamily)